MDIPLQVLLTTTVGIVMFFLGKIYEQHAIAQRNRLELLKTVEELADTLSHVLNILQAKIYLLLGRPDLTSSYSQEDVDNTMITFSENRLKVFGILESKALNTFRTKKYSENLRLLLNELIEFHENYLVHSYQKASQVIMSGDFPDDEVHAFLRNHKVARTKLKDVHSSISELKIKLN